MNRKEIVEQLNDIADELITRKKFQKNLKDVFIKKCLKFIDNEDSPVGRENLLEVIKKVSWFNICDINMFFQIAICDILKSIEGDFYLIYEKDRPESSNHQIISSLALNCGIKKENYILYNKNKRKIEKREINNSAILIVDDYSGSGGTIEEIIEEIEKLYYGNEIYIVVYIWQEKAYENLKKKIEQEKLNNIYHIYEDEDTKTEKSYRDKCKDQKVLRHMIETVCQKCPSKEYKFGHKGTGAMISINGVSPNNNISMLWRKDIIYNEINWTGLLDRDLCWEALDTKKRNLIQKERSLYQMYTANTYIVKKVTWEEFQLMMYLFNEYNVNIEHLRKIMGYDTKEEIKEKINKFEQQGIITTSDYGTVCFKDKEIIKELKRIDKIIMNKIVEKKQNRNIA